MLKRITIKNNLIRRLFLLLLLLMGLGSGASAQMSISGQTCVQPEVTYIYSVSTSVTGQSMQWCIASAGGSGEIVNATNGSCTNGTGLSQISVIWHNAGAVTVNVHNYSNLNGSDPNASGTLGVTVYTPLSPGSITSNNSQTVYQATPVAISCSLPSQGGCGTFTYGYQWQKSLDQSSWSSVPGATAQDLSFTTATTPSQDTYYRRQVTTSGGVTGFSDVAVVHVLSDLTAGTVGPSTQTIFSGDDAAITASTAPQGGNCSGNYTFLWTISGNGTSFGTIPAGGPATNQATYNPTNLTQSYYYQRRTICNGETVLSNIVYVIVVNHLAAGSLTQTTAHINSGEQPPSVTTADATGGMCSGAYEYHWQASTGGSGFTDITGATSKTYQPPSLTAATSYRCRVKCGDETVYTSTYTVSFWPPLSPGIIYTSKTINPGTSPNLTEDTPTGGGGAGSYSYVWYSSTDNVTYNPIANATSEAYNPSSVSVNTYYKRKVTSTTGSTTLTATTPTILITVNTPDPLTAGSISPAGTITIYNNDEALTLSAVGTPSGGNCSNNYTYKWTSSGNGTDFYPIAATVNKPVDQPNYGSFTLTQSMYFQRQTICGSSTALSNIVHVIVVNHLAAGAINRGIVNINYNTAPPAVSIDDAIGGKCGGAYEYHWQVDTGNGFGDITNEIGQSYSPSVLTSTTYYRCRIKCGDETVYSNTYTVNVFPPLTSGTISGSQMINYGDNASITGTSAQGGAGAGTYTYHWYTSSDPNTILYSGPNQNYTANNLTATTTFIRSVSSNGSAYVASNSITVTVYPQVLPGTISASQTINYGDDANLTGTTAQGGAGAGTYTYHWYTSADPNTILYSGPNRDYTATNLTTTTTFIRSVSSNNSAYIPSNSITVTVRPELTPGTISSSQTVTFGGTDPVVTATEAIGGNGVFVYTWWSKTISQTSFKPIPNSNIREYHPTGLALTTSYYRTVTSPGATGTKQSNTITITVTYPTLTAGTISAPSSINTGTTLTISETKATGGNSDYKYIWYTSLNGSSYKQVATGEIYPTSPLTVNTYFKRTVSSSNDPSTILTSNIVFVQVITPPLLPGSIAPVTQTVAWPATATFTSTSASGGEGASSYKYQWYSKNGGVYLPIKDAIGKDYGPSKFPISPTYLIRRVTSGNQSADTEPIKVIVTGLPDDGDGNEGGDCSPLATTPSQDQNYVITSVPREKGMQTSSSLLSQTNCTLMQTMQYFDGLGRPLQTVQVAGSPTGKDVVQPFAYDEFGRETTKYLPYTTAAGDAGSYRSDAFTVQQAFYAPVAGSGVSADTKPYSVTVPEQSPLGRTLEQGAPGAAWQPKDDGTGHTVKMDYTANNTTALATTVSTMLAVLYKVTYSTVSGEQVPALSKDDSYDANTLYVTVSKDENWTSGRGGTTEEYKDKEGRVILKRAFNGTDNATDPQILSTYYVYDDLGNLVFVLPPKSNADNALPDQTTLDNLCYQYRYDARNRLVKKRIPGKDWEYMVYNALDQVVLTQDAVQRGNNQWTVTKYDALGRVIMTGLWNAGSVVADMQNQIDTHSLWDKRDNTNTETGYAISSYPALSSTLTINYYDDYAIPGIPDDYKYMKGTKLTRGLLTGSKTNILSTSDLVTADKMLLSVSYYDNLGHAVQSFKQHYLGSGTPDLKNYDAVASEYYFTNEVKATTRTHFKSGVTAPQLTILNAYIYDHVGRKVESSEQINDGANVVLSHLDYNEIGQLKTKHLHKASGDDDYLQNIAFTYNERGWLAQVNNPASLTDQKLFGMKLSYEDGAIPEYNGNISGMTWQAKVPTGHDLTQTQQSYNYTYDDLNRLTAANYTTTGNVSKFDEALTYDLNGNILTLKRKNATTANTYLNNFTYDYTTGGIGNQLWKVTDAGTANNGGTYTYDDNGNNISDTRNLVSAITYNLLNLPQVITRSSANGGSITYVYDAAGDKLRKTGGGTTRDYISGIEYAGGSIAFIQTEEGRAIPSGSGYSYEYFLKDHLGNTRIAVKQGGTITQVKDYYAFGLDIPANQYSLSPLNNYKYNGKEKQENGNYDYGARFYDPGIARWTSIDEKAEAYSNISPYNYGLNNPISFTDPDGKGPTDPSTFFEKLMAFFGIGPHNAPRNDDEAKESAQRRGPVIAQGQIEERKLNSAQKVADWIPFLGGFMHYVHGSYSMKPNDSEAGLGIGMAMIDAVGGELISGAGKVVEGAGKDLLEGIVKKVDNYAGHLKESDMTGAIRDIFGDPVLKDDGTPFQHLKEVTEALGGIKNQLKKLQVGIRRGTFTEEVLEQAKTLQSALNKQRTRLEQTLAAAKKAANN